MIATAIVTVLLMVGCSSTEHGTAEPAPALSPISAPVSVALQQQNARLLAAAAAALAAGDAAGALQLYNQIDATALTDDGRLGYFLDRADAALQEGDLLLARDLLSKPELLARHPQLSPERHRRWLRLRGDLFGLLGDTGSSVAAYTELTSALADPEERGEIERAIWQVLERTPTSTLNKLAAEPANARLHGWYQLALASREQHDVAAAHPPAPAPGNTVAAISAFSPVPALQRVALLLPRSGTYAAAANAIRDGFMATVFAAQAAGASTPDIKLYDAASGDVLDLYRRAVADGAQLVIGPLDQPALTRLATEPSLPVPVLGLNELNGTPASTTALFRTLSLSAADEAAAVAHRAWREGRRSALALVPDAPWGRRALDAFTDTFTQLGGEVRAGAVYDRALKDFVPVLRPLLGVTAPAAAPGMDAEPPRRRTDIDMVFLVAYPAQGRQIKPTLDFLYADDLPVYATSAIYSGVVDATRDADLGDIRFSTMTWALADAATPAPETSLPAAYRPFFALGADAYLLHPLLATAQPNAGIRIAGHTGTLVLEDGQQIRRIQPWARFRNGRAYLESEAQ
ncbi:MAG: penicillin-binding protein activator [Porticoccaceae bacterium]